MAASAKTVRNKSRLRGPVSDQRRMVEFAIHLVVGWTLAFGILALAPDLERWTVEATAASVATAFRAFSFPATLSGVTVSTWGTSIRVIPECTPLMPTILLCVAILAFPASRSWKLYGLVLGIVVLWVYNIVRLVALIGVLALRPSMFDVIHVFFLQTLTLLVAGGWFVLWTRGPRRRTA